MTRLGELLLDLGDDEPLVLHGVAAPGVLIGRPRVSWAAAAAWLSQHVGGRVFPGPCGLAWVCGARVERILEPEYLAIVRDARTICEAVGVEGGWTVGRCALSLLGHVGPAQYPYKGFFHEWQGETWGYHDCTPGTWPGGMQWDVRACYFTLLCRLPCLRVTVRAGRPSFVGWRAGEEARWRRVLELVEGHKVLRNSLVGCALGSVAGRRYFHRGRAGTAPGRLGPFRPAGLLVCRTAYELCCEASWEVSSVYSATDSVVSVGGEYPSCWEAAGLDVRLVAEGETDVCTTAVYCVGGVSTHYYERGSRFRRGVDRAQRTIVGGASGWLGRRA